MALLLVLVARQETISGLVGAQSGTPTAETDKNTALTQSYDDFLAKMATNLGVGDAAQVDVAIRTTLKQMIDDSAAAGELTAEQATLLKERVDSSEVPLRSVVGRGRGHRDGSDHDRRSSRDRVDATAEATPSV
jgi:Arc/MetJ family transcription regulator